MRQTHLTPNFGWIFGALSLAAVALTPAAAQAATTFNFQLPPSTPPAEYFVPGLTMSQDNIGLTASAPTQFLYQDQNGLGANNPIINPADTAVDGTDVVQFQFNKQVMLDSITFTQIDTIPDWAMVLVGPTIVAMGPLNGSGGVYTLDLTGIATNLRVSSVVQVSGMGLLEIPSGFQIGAITVEQAPGAPLPSSVAAGLTMLACLGAVKMLCRPQHKH